MSTDSQNYKFCFFIRPTQPKSAAALKYMDKIIEQQRVIRHLKFTIEAKDNKAIDEIEKKRKEYSIISKRNQELCSKVNKLSTENKEQTSKILKLEKCIETLKKANSRTSAEAMEYNRLLKKHALLNKQLAESHSSKIIGYNKLVQVNLRLTNEAKSLRQALKVRTDELFAVKKVFSPAQFYVLRNRTNRRYKCKWDKEDASKALSLYDCSVEAYKMLLANGFPFPSIATVQTWKEKLENYSKTKDLIKSKRAANDDPEYQPESKKIKEDHDLGIAGVLECVVELTEGSNTLQFGNDSELTESESADKKNGNVTLNF